MRILFGYDSEAAASQWLSMFIGQQEPVVTILSSYISPAPDIDVSEFKFGNVGEVVVIDLADAQDDFVDRVFDEIVYVSGEINGAFKPELFRGFSAESTSFYPVARERRGIKKDFIKKKRSALVSSGFEWNGHIFQTRDRDIMLITGRATKVLALRSLGEEHADFHWHTEDNQSYLFTAAEFLQFSIAVDEHVESEYIKSWSRPA